ncbi:hypothetical protein [Halobacillus campisalis]|uniref:Uncharacterized protein n=1 Tax=Halobacillus campisalis TaxID=435909 RepID=A0ABW2K835_9BACI|nr:hypothetical protein [Halobacillus campisalis]
MSKEFMSSTTSEAPDSQPSNDSPSTQDPDHCSQPIYLIKAVDYLC